MLRRSIAAGLSTVRRLCTLGDADFARTPLTRAAVAGEVHASDPAAGEASLLQVLQSEIRHELSSDPFEGCRGGSLGEFTLDADFPESHDIVLRKKSESEEVVVSTLLSQYPKYIKEEFFFPRLALMKVCVAKPGCSAVLLFNCTVRGVGENDSKLYIHSVSYLPSTSIIDSMYYMGPSFRDLDLSLQDAFENYLITKGINPYFNKYILLHLHKKERKQYTSWLQKLETKATLVS